jgi:hypothetical protein
MPAVLTVRDEHLTPGDAGASFELEFPTESITVRELIRERVYQEVEDLNRRAAAAKASAVGYTGLVTPRDLERALNGEPKGNPRVVDWKAQYAIATDAYEAGRFLVLVGDHQTESLDEVITIGRGTEVTFLRLVMLVGG